MGLKLMGRKRKLENADLPLGLYTRSLRGVTRYFYRNVLGKDTYFPVEFKLADIKQSVIEFNETHRNSAEALKYRADKYNVRVHIVWHKIKQNLDEENEGKSQSTLNTFVDFSDFARHF